MYYLVNHVVMQKEALLIITDEDTRYGVEHGYYANTESIMKGIERRNMRVINYGEAESLKLDGYPQEDGNDIYFLNPYSDRYIRITDNDLLVKMSLGKSLAIANTLIKMGAKHITIDEQVTSKKDSRFQSEVGGSKEGIGGSVGVNYHNAENGDFKKIIESHDPNRVAKTVKEVKQYVRSRGLEDDPSICFWLERFCSDGKLSGKESIVVTFLSEVQSDLKILAGMDLEVFNVKGSFIYEQVHINTFTKKLIVEF